MIPLYSYRHTGGRVCSLAVTRATAGVTARELMAIGTPAFNRPPPKLLISVVFRMCRIVGGREGMPAARLGRMVEGALQRPAAPF